ncbi:MAG: MGMT family protein [Alphaproteobacteria bacterium]|nr:MGMT family protein [Alphaproteobacteria bacterium]
MKLRSSVSSPACVAVYGFRSSVGKLLVGVTERGEICRSGFAAGRLQKDLIDEWRRRWPKTDFRAGRGAISFAECPVLLVGTAFQQAVWRAIAAIPKGRTATYTDIACKVGRPRAVRAVGTACGANPVPYFVPCHRILACGGIGGFSAGLEIKKKLLESEKVEI